MKLVNLFADATALQIVDDKFLEEKKLVHINLNVSICTKLTARDLEKKIVTEN